MNHAERYETKDQPATAETYTRDLIEAHGVNYRAEFVPQSQSRNAGDKHRRLNWRVTIAKGERALTFPYTQGTGFLPKLPPGTFTPGYPARVTLHDAAILDSFAETGAWEHHKVKPPTFADVLYCLLSDAYALECDGFEDWADEHGYDPDSRKAEAIYKECMETAFFLRSILPDMDEARAAFEDY